MAKSKMMPAVKSRIAAINADTKAGRFSEAWHSARQLWVDEPTDAHVRLMQSVVQQACEQAIEAGHPGDTTKYLQWANSLPAGASPDWTITLAHLHAKAGLLPTAMKLLQPIGNPQATAQAMGYAADKSILSRQADVLPAEHHAAYRSVLAAFEQYHSGNDDAARESLNTVGLQSPYLEWKVLLRGLIAYSAKDDARAIENFQRLNVHRLPARLAQPIRSAIDLAFRQQLPPASAKALEKAYQGMAPSNLAGKVRKLRQQCQPKRGLEEAFATAQSLLPMIPPNRPDLKVKLENCMYGVLTQFGMPTDLTHYRKAFGKPPHDPDFHLLQGNAYEQAENLQEALDHWRKYAEWLKVPPPSWSAELTRRARASILVRAANIATDLTEGGSAPDIEDLIGMFAPGKKAPAKKAKAKTGEVDPLPFLKEAVALAPDWDAPVLTLMAHYRSKQDDRMAAAVAEDYLKRNPDSLPVLQGLADSLTAFAKPPQLLEVRRKIHSLNPLDQDATQAAIHAHVSVARMHAAKKDYEECDASLAAAVQLNDGNDHYATLAIQAALAVQRGEDGDAIEEKVNASMSMGVLARYLRLIHATIFKFKPAVKKAVAARFDEAMKAKPTPIALSALWMEVERIAGERWKFTGEATLRKKVLTAILASSQPGHEVTFEALVLLLERSKEWATLQKLTAKMGKIHPRNPLFPFIEACAQTNLKPTKDHDRKILRLATRAEFILEENPNSKHAHLLPEIRQMVDDFRPDFSMFDAIFGRR